MIKGKKITILKYREVQKGKSMKRYGFLVLCSLLLIGCGGDSTHDGSQGPKSTTQYKTLGTIAYQDSKKVTIESVKQYSLEGVAVDIALSDDGNVAYIASGNGGLEVVDVTDPQRPYLIYSYDLPEYVNFVEVEDGMVYVAYIPEGLQGYYRLHAFDVSNPYAPYYVGGRDGSSRVGHDSMLRDDYYYEVNSEGLEIFKAYGRSYEKVASYYLHDSAYALALRNNYIFIANGRVGLTILKTNIGGAVGRVH